MGDKSGICRFYRRVWKNIFYEGGGDKEREGGFLGIGWGGKEENRERIEGFLGYVWEGTIY